MLKLLMLKLLYIVSPYLLLTCRLSPQDQYQFCYRASLEYLGSFDHYAT